MSNLIYYRIFGYVTTLLMHVYNLRVMKGFITEEAVKDPQVLVFKSMEYRFFTSWTFVLQIVYAVFSLICDMTILANGNKKDYRLPKLMGSSRDIMFSGLVWPCTMVVFSVFWSVYLYDKNLIFPDFLEKVIPPASNHILHSAIVPVVFWEVAFRPRRRPRSHRRNIAQLMIHVVTYFLVMLYTYIESGIWLYPLFAKLYGSIYFVMLLLFLVATFIAWYYTQWVVTYLVHGTDTSIQKLR